MYPREKPNDDHIDQLSLTTATDAKDRFFKAEVREANEHNGKFSVLWQGILEFEERDDLNLAMKVSSDFMRADVTYLLTQVSTGAHFMPQHIFEDSKKMQVPMLEPGFYRIIVFMQNAEMHLAQAKFAPVIYSFNFKLFSFDQRSRTTINNVELDNNDVELRHLESVEVVIPFSSPEKMECYSHGRRLPESLT